MSKVVKFEDYAAEAVFYAYGDQKDVERIAEQLFIAVMAREAAALGVRNGLPWMYRGPKDDPEAPGLREQIGVRPAHWAFTMAQGFIRARETHRDKIRELEQRERDRDS